jgi:hypothetical protein
MKAIVVVFFRTRRAEVSEKQLRLCRTGTLAESIPETRVPPFWTWFIRNPRSYSLAFQNGCVRR